MSEADHDCLKRIQIITGSDVELSETKMSFEGMRHFVHTPKDGKLESTDKNYLVETYANNQFIKDYMAEYDMKLQKRMEKAVEYRHDKQMLTTFNGPLKAFMLDNSDYR